MRHLIRILLTAAVILAAGQPVRQPAEAFEIDLCDYCRRIWNDSPSRIRATADANGRAKDIHVCSPFCLAEVLKLKSHYKLESAQLVIWDEREELRAMMVPSDSARILIGVKDERDLSHDPDIAAFRNDKQLGAAKAKLGGKTITWEKLLEKCKKLAAETDDSVESPYRKLNMRKY